MMMSVDIEGGLAPGRERAIQRWGPALTPGFTIVPDVMIRGQAKLGIAPREMCVLLHLLTFWWVAEEWPRPKLATIARRMGVEERTVQRAIGNLIELGLIERTKIRTKFGDFVQGFNLSGLLAKLERLAETEAAMAAEFSGTRES
jgi:hypothetical protein